MSVNPLKIPEAADPTQMLDNRMRQMIQGKDNDFDEDDEKSTQSGLQAATRALYDTSPRSQVSTGK